MNCRHKRYLIWLTDSDDKDSFCVTCVQCGLNVRLYPRAAAPPGMDIKWGAERLSVGDLE